LNIVEKSHFALPEVVRQHFIGEVGKFILFQCLFPQDVTYQKLLKLVNHAQNYSRNEKGAVF